MADYVYFLENRLSSDQQYALNQVREASRELGMTVFLTGGAVRDLTSGSPVRDLDLSVQGNALKLKKTLEKRGGVLSGEHEPSQTLFLRFPGGARVEVSAIRQEEHPKPGKVVYRPGTILEDLRRRDFTANAMALSLNEGSYGLLMDPLNGVADIESRLLRLVSNYGFIEEPVRMIRATRLLARLGWEMDEKTQARFQNAKEEGMISALSAYHRGYELQEIGHEEDGLKILKVLESEGWMSNLFPAWTSASADAAGLEQLRELTSQLQMQGVNPDTSASQMQLLTAKLPERDVAELKRLFVRQGFVHEWERLEADAKEFAKVLASKQAALPSEIWKLFTSSNAEAILWLGLTSKAAGIQAKYNNFFAVWPEARQKIPYALLQEMRITPELPGYQDLLKQIFLQLIDGGLESEEKMRAFLEPFSPPAPPPPVSIRRTRGKKAAGAKARADVDEDDDDEAPGRSALREGDDEKEEKDDGDDDDSAEELPIRLVPAREVLLAVEPDLDPDDEAEEYGVKSSPKVASKQEPAPLATASPSGGVSDPKGKGHSKDTVNKAGLAAVASRPASPETKAKQAGTAPAATSPAKEASPPKGSIKTPARTEAGKSSPAKHATSAPEKSSPEKLGSTKAGPKASSKAVKSAPPNKTVPAKKVAKKAAKAARPKKAVAAKPPARKAPATKNGKKPASARKKH